VSVITEGVGLNMTVMSYRDNVDFGVVGDRGMVRDAWPLMEGLESSLDDLCELICNKQRPKRKPAKGHSGNGAKPHTAPAGAS
jgi:hypothetical protein